MAKETQDTVGEVGTVPINDSDAETSEHESAALGLVADPAAATSSDAAGHSEADFSDDFDRPDDPGSEGSEDRGPPAHESEPEAVTSAPPSLALWLSGELRPSPSKSTPPAAPISVDPPETLAPVAVTQTELSDEDLAVLPAGSRRGESPSVRNGVLAVLGAAAAVFLFSYWWSLGGSRQVHTEPAAQPTRAEPVDQSAPVPPVRTIDSAPPAEVTTEDPGTRKLVHGRWVAPAADAEDTLDAEARARGPSVGRFPDLPAEYWSELRRKDVERRAQRERELLTEKPVP